MSGAGPVLEVGAVVVDDERLLLVRRTTPPDAGVWSVPVAQVDHDEPLVAAVVRAVDEGAGLEAVCEGLIGHLEHLGARHRVVLAFEATVLEDAQPAPGAAWVPLDEVTERPLADGWTELLAERGILRLIA